MSKASEKGPYKIGYGKPPVRNQFKRGKSGNPRGRPIQTPDLTTQIGKKLTAKRSVTISGVPVRLPLKEILVERLIELAAKKGDLKVLLLLLNESEKYRKGQEKARYAQPKFSRQEIEKMTEQERVDLYMSTLKIVNGTDSRSDSDD